MKTYIKIIPHFASLRKLKMPLLAALPPKKGGRQLYFFATRHRIFILAYLKLSSKFCEYTSVTDLKSYLAYTVLKYSFDDY